MKKDEYKKQNKILKIIIVLIIIFIISLILIKNPIKKSCYVDDCVIEFRKETGTFNWNCDSIKYREYESQLPLYDDITIKVINVDERLEKGETVTLFGARNENILVKKKKMGDIPFGVTTSVLEMGEHGIILIEENRKFRVR